MYLRWHYHVSFVLYSKHSVPEYLRGAQVQHWTCFLNLLGHAHIRQVIERIEIRVTHCRGGSKLPLEDYTDKIENAEGTPVKDCRMPMEIQDPMIIQRRTDHHPHGRINLTHAYDARVMQGSNKKRVKPAPLMHRCQRTSKRRIIASTTDTQFMNNKRLE